MEYSSCYRKHTTQSGVYLDALWGASPLPDRAIMLVVVESQKYIMPKYNSSRCIVDSAGVVEARAAYGNSERCKVISNRADLCALYSLRCGAGDRRRSSLCRSSLSASSQGTLLSFSKESRNRYRLKYCCAPELIQYTAAVYPTPFLFLTFEWLSLCSLFEVLNGEQLCLGRVGDLGGHMRWCTLNNKIHLQVL